MAFEGGDIILARPEQDILERIKHYIAAGDRFIIHNAAFELDWFRVKYGIEFKDVWDTMLASQVLNAGKTIADEASDRSVKTEARSLDHLGYWDVLLEEGDDTLDDTKKASRFAHDLKSVVYRYAKATIQKDQGNSDWAREPLNEEQVRYAKDDVRYLIQVYHKQREFISKHGLDRVAALEMRVLIPVTRMRHNGLGIDKEHWLEEANECGKVAEALEEELNPQFGLELAKQTGEASLFGEYIPKAFKISSSSQLAKFFGLENADESILRTIDHPLIPRLLEYKENYKIFSTYGEKYLSFVQEDGKIHSPLIQAETATGRFSSRRPNQQNVSPSMLKGNIVPDPGYVTAIFDYSSVESRILAYVAQDEAFIRSVNSNDVHWENAKKIFHLPEDATRDGVFSVNGKSLSGDELRRKAKGVSFG